MIPTNACKENGDGNISLETWSPYDRLHPTPSGCKEQRNVSRSTVNIKQSVRNYIATTTSTSYYRYLSRIGPDRCDDGADDKNEFN
ncbi:unnamed protein product [Calypogeia fissa]